MRPRPVLSCSPAKAGAQFGEDVAAQDDKAVAIRANSDGALRANSDRALRANSDRALRASGPLPAQGHGSPLPALSPPQSTLSELFAAEPRDGGWIGFLAAQLDPGKPLLWVQERMAILESGRIYPPGLACSDILHVTARDARSALWAMEEGLRCAALSAVIGELWGDPRVLDFTATRRLAVAAERSGVACWLVRLGGSANLSGARRRWRVASAPSLPHPFDPRASGLPVWDAELFRARGAAPGRWSITHEPGGAAANPVAVVATAGDRAVDEDARRRVSA